MGLFQLSRLYYCFANDKIHTKKGYPKWLFYVMVIWGILYFISSSLDNGVTAEAFFSKCEYDKNLNIYYYRIERLINQIWVWSLLNRIAFLAWDLSTLCLFLHKIRSFTKQRSSNQAHAHVHQRVMSILYKISILTIFYELAGTPGMLGEIYFQVWGWDRFSSALIYASQVFWPVATSYAIVLMLEHNKKEYAIFLKRTYKYKLHWICCCFRFIVIEQINQLDGDQEIKKLSTDTPNGGNRKGTQWETRNETVDIPKIEQMGQELSIETTIIED